jgi:hypothetical protein
VLVVVAPKDRKMRIEVGYGLEGTLTDAIASRIIRNEMTPKFKNNDHNGGIEGFATSIIRFTVDRVTVIVLSNYEAARARRVAADLAAIVFGEKYELPIERTVVKVDPKIYDAYVGEYELEPGFVFTVTREGDHLMMQATGQGKAELFPTSETNFFPKVVRADITFVKDAGGSVTHLVLNQNGRQMNAKKIR